MIRFLEGRGELEMTPGEPTAAVLGIPQGVLEVIGQRLNRLSDDCVGVLTTAAVIDREFEFKLLDNLNSDIGETRLLELVEEALDAHILQESQAQRDRYQFSNALVQQTLLEKLSTSRRVRMHALVGEALEAAYKENPEAAGLNGIISGDYRFSS